jgi:hypothetical protein
MKSCRQSAIDFVVLNHDEDLLAMLNREWLTETLRAPKDDAPRVLPADYSPGVPSSRVKVLAGPSSHRHARW